MSMPGQMSPLPCSAKATADTWCKGLRFRRSRQSDRSCRLESSHTLRTSTTGTSVGGEARYHVRHRSGADHLPQKRWHRQGQGLDLAESGSCSLSHLGDDLDAGTTAAAATVLFHRDQVGDLAREAIDIVRDEDISGLKGLDRDVIRDVGPLDPA
jgi:hypothetical protein